MPTPRVSVIIPAFNAERWLGQTIQSVLDQTYQDFEVIVIDDGSTDSTSQVVQHFCDSRIRYIYQPNQGLPNARNAGILASFGPYLGFLDADDLWHCDMLRETASFLDAHPDLGVVRTGYRYIDGHGNALPARPEWAAWEGDVFERLLVNNAFIPITALVRRKCIDAVGLFDAALPANEDWDLWLRIAAAGFRFGFIHRVLAMYRRHGSNMSLQYGRMRASALAVLDKISGHPDLARRVSHLKNRAYSRYLARFCIEAFRSDYVEQAVSDFSLAVKHDVSVMADLSLYYQVACISVAPAHIPRKENLNLKLGQKYLNALVNHIDSVDLVASPGDKRRAKAAAHLAWAMVNYSYQEDMIAARRHLITSIRCMPFRWLSWAWLIRTVIGKKRIVRLRSGFEHLRRHSLSGETHRA